jgi:hypothetical protein
VRSNRSAKLFLLWRYAFVEWKHAGELEGEQAGEQWVFLTVRMREPVDFDSSSSSAAVQRMRGQPHHCSTVPVVHEVKRTSFRPRLEHWSKR